jgi:hypothetical protein
MWIRCDERLPENSGKVLVSDGAGIEFGRWIGGCWVDSGYMHGFDLVTHWMPLPELPEENDA